MLRKVCVRNRGPSSCDSTCHLPSAQASSNLMGEKEGGRERRGREGRGRHKERKEEEEEEEEGKGSERKELLKA